MYQNLVTLKKHPTLHSVSLGFVYTECDSDVVGYKRVSLELGPVAKGVKVSSEMDSIPLFDLTFFCTLEVLSLTTKGRQIRE
jgi:hypothetical protein